MKIKSRNEFLKELQIVAPELYHRFTDPKFKYSIMHDGMMIMKKSWYKDLLIMIGYTKDGRTLNYMERKDGARPYDDIILYIKENKNMIGWWLL